MHRWASSCTTRTVVLAGCWWVCSQDVAHLLNYTNSACVGLHVHVYFYLKTDNERMFSQHVQSHLLPDHTYSVVSGGDPLCIPDLTWEQLRQFHATHYHPSNAR